VVSEMMLRRILSTISLVKMILIRNEFELEPGLEDEFGI
jgi:hypothetical protein